MDKAKNNNSLEEFLELVQVDKFSQLYSRDIADGKYFGMPLKSIIAAENNLKNKSLRPIAYFSMEYGLTTSFYNTYSSFSDIDPKNKIYDNTIFSNYRLADYFFDVGLKGTIDLPIYSGGLGVLAGDTMKTMADYKLPALGIGILWRCGYFKQKFWFKYGQVPEKMYWEPWNYPGLIPLKNTVEIRLKDRTIRLKLWKYYVYSYKHDYAIPLILLDADIEGNAQESVSLTQQLYRSENNWIKIAQRVILGFGGVAAIRELDYNIDKFHLNEGHAIFSFIESARGLSGADTDKLKDKFFYTCHTPVEAGHDRFADTELKKNLLDEDYSLMEKFGREKSGLINLTLLSMNVCSSVNAVAKSHHHIMTLQFPEYKKRIKYVTNGVHPYTWISKEFMEAFKDFPSVLENIEANPMILSRADGLKDNPAFRKRIWQAHQANKKRLCALLEKWKLKEDIFTLCWARRIAAYKRPSLILHDIKKLLEIAENVGPLQIIFAGKAHPNDNLGFTYINELMDKVDALHKDYDKLKVIIWENYDSYLASFFTSGVDLWLNNPLPPFEASGTSGMKAILNGVVQLTTCDGWVKEAEGKGIGKFFGYRAPENSIGNESDLHIESDSRELYKTLQEMTGLYYKTNKNPEVDLSSSWIDMMINCISAGSYFNTYRMLDEYKCKIWNIA